MQKRALLTTISSTCVEAPSASSSGVSPSHHQAPPFSSGTKSTPVSTKKNAPSPSPRTTGKPNKPTSSTKSNKVKSKTIRIEIPVHMPTKQSFCEFVYDDLLKKHSESANSDDPFNDPNEDEDVKRIARQMEEKYGSGGGKRSAWQDYLERGSGYDETDPFVDNTEAYDELIPHEMTTKHGGFYINSGQLEFKPVDRDDESIERPPPIASGIKRRKSFNGASMPVPGRKKKKEIVIDQVKPLELKAPAEPPKTLNLVMDKEHTSTKQQSSKQPVNDEMKQHSKNAPHQNAQMQVSKQQQHQHQQQQQQHQQQQQQQLQQQHQQQQQQITQQSSKQHPHTPHPLLPTSTKSQQAQQSSKHHSNNVQRRPSHSQGATQSSKNLPVSQQQQQQQQQRQPSSSSSSNHHSQNSLANPRIANPAVPQPPHAAQHSTPHQPAHQQSPHQPVAHKPHQLQVSKPKAAHQQPMQSHLQPMLNPIDAIIMEQIRLRNFWPQMNSMNMFNRLIQEQMNVVSNATSTSRPSSSNTTPVIVSNNSAPRPTPPPARASSVKPTGNCSTSGPG